MIRDCRHLLDIVLTNQIGSDRSANKLGKSVRGRHCGMRRLLLSVEDGGIQNALTSSNARNEIWRRKEILYTGGT